ncbi:hypothetical protein CYMTET_39567 [Cymbomonas tetramitiformis]|uniref:Uncharacterized protein n=1 Tax=Cymbomonas tetramitiformis TaxID=36881 RepID=A0AAE0C9U0_9CHLO|nr:hypothetical protein CYMTET_39567 [Cymbomonas tetramitiformis]
MRTDEGQFDPENADADCMRKPSGVNSEHDSDEASATVNQHPGKNVSALSSKGSFPRLLVHTTGIIVAYSVYGYLLEKVTSARFGPGEEKFTFFFVLVFITCVFNGAVAKISLFFRPGDNDGAVPQQNYMMIATTYVGAMYGSSTALMYVSYPTQVVAKSCKMIPVMVMGVILGKKYSKIKYVCVAMITFGVFLFIYKGKSAIRGGENEDNAHFVGLLLLLFSLGCDGFTSAFEEKVVSLYNPSTLQLMLFCNFYGSILTFIGILIQGEIMPAVAFFLAHPSILVDILWYATMGAIGQLFIFGTIREFGALVCSTATTLRKFFNVIWSVYYFGHFLGPRQMVGTLLVFGGLALELHSRYTKSGRGVCKTWM